MTAKEALEKKCEQCKYKNNCVKGNILYKNGKLAFCNYHMLYEISLEEAGGATGD